jgi:CheY-like chemotaxis protein/HPt (histidine-containing phosphotransfer) domain-containing protein
VLLNLLNNGIKFTHAGHVVLGVKQLGSDEAGARVRFSVSDSGIGIADSKLDRLFQRFSQVDGSISREFGGTGLGLAISKRLVELMGGQIGVESEFGEGSTFWFTVTLPLATEASMPVPSHQTRARCTRPARILLAEDVVVNQEIACSMLTTGGHLADVVSDGSDAIMAVEAHDYDLVLMDIQMPGMDGMTATKHIRALPGPAGSVPIIAMTANVLPQQIASFKAAGMDGHLGKPFRRDKLLATIDRYRADAAGPADVSPPRPQGATSVIDAEAFEAAIEVLGVDKMNDLLRKFGSQLEGGLLNASGTVEDRAGLAREAHRLVSSAGMLGFVSLSQGCATLEAALHAHENVDALLADLRQACRGAVNEISARLAQPAVA